MANSLGDFNFFSFGNLLDNGPPETVRQTSVPIQRPGVNGTGYIQTGIKGRPFQMRSVFDATTKANAAALIKEYEDAVAQELLVLVHSDIDYSATPVFNQYWVLDVVASWRRVSAATGGVNSGLYPVEAIWLLVPNFVEPEEEE